MIVRNYEQVDAEKAAEAEGVTVRVVIGKEQGAPNFVMRVFDIEPGASSPRHSHDWEHEVFVLAGNGTVSGEDGDEPVKPGDVVFVPQDEEHQFRNEGDEELRFLCLIPHQKK